MLTMDKNFRTKVEEAIFYKEDDGYYLDVTYLLEDDQKVVKIHIPKLRVPLEEFENLYNDNPLSNDQYSYVQLGLHTELRAEKIKDGSYGTYEYEVIKRKPIKMTVEEIEKTLGYKVEIVAKEESCK